MGLNSPLIEILRAESSFDLKYRCGFTPYNFNFEAVKATPIPKPKQLEFNESINVVMTIALTQEMGVSQREALKRYLTYLEGWSVQSNYQVVNTGDKFRELFNDMDIYIPVTVLTNSSS